MSEDRSLVGLTWGHRRAIAPLKAASAAFTRAQVQWEVRDLARFEHEPLHIVAADYDLIVFDHPFCGVIAASGCLLPLPRPWIVETLGHDADERFIGRSFDSYQYQGNLWGLPVDGACNHAAFRRDLLRQYGDVPRTWKDVVDLGLRVRQEGKWLGLSANGHHGLLAVAALMANAGNPFPESSRSGFNLSNEALSAAIDTFRAVLEFCPPESLEWNSIQLLDALGERDDVVYCPAVFGFATYGEQGRLHPLGFGPFPGARAPYHSGAVLGGAAVGISANCRNVETALEYLRFLANAETQLNVLGSNSGQPARVECWKEPKLDASFGGFFQATAATMASCSLRPRFVGYQQFESRAGRLLEQLLRQEVPTTSITAAIAAEAERVRDGELMPPYLELKEEQ